MSQGKLTVSRYAHSKLVVLETTPMNLDMTGFNMSSSTIVNGGNV